MLALVAGIGACSCEPRWSRKKPDQVLEMRQLKEGQRIIVDGNAADLPWKSAKELSVPLEGSEDGSVAEVTLRAAHDGEFLYVMAIWADPEVSLNRYWEYVAPGKWKKRSGEDAFSINWSPGAVLEAYRELGCAMFCHDGAHSFEDGRQAVDFWYWGAQTTARKPTLRDMWLPQGPRQRLRGDSQPKGSDNQLNLSEEYAGPYGVPKRVGPKRSPYYLDESNAQPLTYKQLTENLDFEKNKGWIVALDIQRPIRGSRADVAAKARHVQGQWVLEMRRKLTTRESDDQPIVDAGVSFWFSVAVHNGTDGAAHSISRPIELRFMPSR